MTKISEKGIEKAAEAILLARKTGVELEARAAITAYLDAVETERFAGAGKVIEPSEKAIADIVSRHSNRVTTIEEIAVAAYRAGQIAQAEEDAALIKANTIQHSSSGDHLIPRGRRHSAGLAYATAILANADRLRAENEGDGE